MQDGAPGSDLRSAIPGKDAVLILGVQRSGTTLLGDDIASLGLLGRPREHFLTVEAARGPRPDQYAALSRLGMGEGDCFGLTLMVNYLSRFTKWLAPGAAPVGPLDLEDRAIRFFRDNFERLTVITLRRDPLWHVAYSHWRVAVTNQYHRDSGGIHTGERDVVYADGDPVTPDPEGILLMLAQVMEKYRRIDGILDRNGITPVALTYAEVAGSFPHYLRRVTAAAGHPDIDIANARRSMIKLTPETELAAARTALRDYFTE